MIEALRAAALMVALAADALLSVFWWWAAPLLAALAVGAWRSLRPTGVHRLPRRAVTATGEDIPVATQAPTGGDTDTITLAVVTPSQTRPEGANETDR